MLRPTRPRVSFDVARRVAFRDASRTCPARGRGWERGGIGAVRRTRARRERRERRGPTVERRRRARRPRRRSRSRRSRTRPRSCFFASGARRRRGSDTASRRGTRRRTSWCAGRARGSRAGTNERPTSASATRREGAGGSEVRARRRGGGPERASAPVGAGDAADGEEKAARARRRGGRVFGGMRASRAYPKARGGRGRERRAEYRRLRDARRRVRLRDRGGGGGVRGQHIPFLTTWEIQKTHEETAGRRPPPRAPSRASSRVAEEARAPSSRRARPERAPRASRAVSMCPSTRAPARPFSPPRGARLLVMTRTGNAATQFSSTRSRKSGYAPNGCPVSGIGHRRSWAPRIDRKTHRLFISSCPARCDRCASFEVVAAAQVVVVLGTNHHTSRRGPRRAG